MAIWSVLAPHNNAIFEAKILVIRVNIIPMTKSILRLIEKISSICFLSHLPIAMPHRIPEPVQIRPERAPIMLFKGLTKPRAVSA